MKTRMRESEIKKKKKPLLVWIQLKKLKIGIEILVGQAVLKLWINTVKYCFEQ